MVIDAEPLSLIYMNKASMIGTPEYEDKTETSLACARNCIADPLCVSFALYRDVQPVGDVSCRRYEELGFVVYDTTSVIYLANVTMPFL